VKDHRTGRKSLAVRKGANSNGQHLKVFSGGGKGSLQDPECERERNKPEFSQTSLSPTSSLTSILSSPPPTLLPVSLSLLTIFPPPIPFLFFSTHSTDLSEFGRPPPSLQLLSVLVSSVCWVDSLSVPPWIERIKIQERRQGGGKERNQNKIVLLLGLRFLQVVRDPLDQFLVWLCLFSLPVYFCLVFSHLVC
jgi:hypothetical protein